MLLTGLSNRKWAVEEAYLINWLNQSSDTHWLATGDWHENGKYKNCFSNLDHKGVDLVCWSPLKTRAFALRTASRLFLRINRYVESATKKLNLKSERSKWIAGDIIPETMIWLQPADSLLTVRFFRLADLWALVDADKYTAVDYVDRQIKTDIGIADSTATMAQFNLADLMPLVRKSLIIEIPVKSTKKIVWSASRDKKPSNYAGDFYINDQRCRMSVMGKQITCQEY